MSSEEATPETLPERAGFDFDRSDPLPDVGPDAKDLAARVIEACRTVFDPEIPVNIVELGLIYDVIVGENSKVDVVMTLTAPSCPMAEQIPGEVETAIRGVSGVGDIHVELVFEPSWHPGLMSEEARLELGMF